MIGSQPIFFDKCVKSYLLIVTTIHPDILNHQVQIMRTLHSARQSLQTEMHYMDMQPIECGWIVKVHSYICQIQAKFLFQDAVDRISHVLQKREMLACQITQRVKFRMAKQSHQMQFLSLFKVSVLEIRHNQKIIIPKENSLSFRLTLNDIVHPLYMCQLFFQQSFSLTGILLSTLIVNRQFFATILILMFLGDRIYHLHFD